MEVPFTCAHHLAQSTDATPAGSALTDLAESLPDDRTRRCAGDDEDASGRLRGHNYVVCQFQEELPYFIDHMLPLLCEAGMGKAPPSL